MICNKFDCCSGMIRYIFIMFNDLLFDWILVLSFSPRATDCQFNNRVYPNAAEWNYECNKCLCFNGQVQCSQVSKTIYFKK